MNIDIPSTDSCSYLKRKDCLYVFGCLHGNICTPFKKYFSRTNHSFNIRNRLSSVELAKTKLEFGGQSFFRIQKLNSRGLFRQRVNEHLFNLFKYSLIIIVIIIIIINY